MNLDLCPAVNIGFGCEDSPLQHGGFGCLGRLDTQAMKCLFMVMSLNPALLISTTDFTCLRWIWIFFFKVGYTHLFKGHSDAHNHLSG